MGVPRVEGNRIKIETAREVGETEAGSEREIRLLPDVIDVLRAAKPLHVGINEHVFKNQEGQLLNFHTWRAGIWYRILRGTGVRERKPYSTRHTFISAGLSNGVNIKWLAEYCGTSVTMIEKHYGKYIGGNIENSFQGFLGGQTRNLYRNPGKGYW